MQACHFCEVRLIGSPPCAQGSSSYIVSWLPAELQSYTVYTGSISAAAKQPQGAQTLLSLLTSPAAIEIFKALGFEPAPR
jgi:ABC-type molybdate transport system substrate-binding protein